MKTTRLWLLTAGAFVLGVQLSSSSSGGAAGIQQAQQSRRDTTGRGGSESGLPVVFYTTTDDEMSDLRRIRNGRYDKRMLGPITEAEVSEGITARSSTNHWDAHMPSIPSTRSDAVIIGEIITGQAHMSNDRSGVYSEFMVRVQEVLKDNQEAPVVTGKIVTAEREGGEVRFSSGSALTYTISDQRMPQTGKTYVLFLKYSEQEQDYSILTGYELRDGRVVPLDCSHKFAVYEGTDEELFLFAVKYFIENPEKETRFGEESRIQ
jgi:hypothetical protein